MSAVTPATRSVNVVFVFVSSMFITLCLVVGQCAMDGLMMFCCATSIMCNQLTFLKPVLFLCWF